MQPLLPPLKAWRAALARVCRAQAQRHADAARLLADKAAALAAARAPPLQLKKLHVLAALEADAFRTLALGPAAAGGSAGGPAAAAAGAAPGGMRGGRDRAAAATLEGLMSVEAAAEGSRAFEGAWRGAEAYHFWLLAHRQLYCGQVGAPEATVCCPYLSATVCRASGTRWAYSSLLNAHLSSLMQCTGGGCPANRAGAAGV